MAWQSREEGPGGGWREPGSSCNLGGACSPPLSNSHKGQHSWKAQRDTAYLACTTPLNAHTHTHTGPHPPELISSTSASGAAGLRAAARAAAAAASAPSSNLSSSLEMEAQRRDQGTWPGPAAPGGQRRQQTRLQFQRPPAAAARQGEQRGGHSAATPAVAVHPPVGMGSAARKRSLIVSETS